MNLRKNVIAPHFALKDIYDRMIDLDHYREKKILIAFFRHAGCPFCNLRVHALTKIHEEMKVKGLEMIFFFESKAPVILRSSFHRGVSPIPIIADNEKRWYNVYGIENAPTKSAISHMTSFVQTAYKAYRSNVPIHLMESGESISTMPAEFLVDRGLVIKHLHYSQRLNDRLDLDVIKNFAIQA
ncbi:MAG TPA: redoxin domain-containing protein [Chryseosolibacter sp.]|nr:redoxin domain-containing protein [Chryseosolibacter sp.]